jgi:hypothetical protein
MYKCADPVIKKYTGLKPKTQIEFTPSYERFADPADNKLVAPELLADEVRTRCYYAAAYAGFTSSDCRVYFQGEQIPVTNLLGLAKILFPEEIPRFSVTIKPQEIYQHQSHSWEVVCLVTTSTQATGVMNATMVNGIPVREGKHIDHLRAQLKKELRKWYEANYKNLQLAGFDNKLAGCLFLMANCKIPAPQWGGQRKDVMPVPGRFPHYLFPAKFIARIAEATKPYVLDNIKGYKPPNKKMDLAKYTPASKAGGSESNLCSLILVEGDSVKHHIIGPVKTYLGAAHYCIPEEYQ